jgi:hypothetical protein
VVVVVVVCGGAGTVVTVVWRVVVVVVSGSLEQEAKISPHMQNTEPTRIALFIMKSSVHQTIRSSARRQTY